jgi:hypothetical protein
LEAEKQGRPLEVIGFVHGWHNNSSPANENSKNLLSFKKSLEFLAAGNDKSEAERQKETEDNKLPVIVGIYFSWRGESVTVPGLNVLTYYSRRDTANRVGGPSLTEAVMRLSEEIKGPRPYFDVDDFCKAKNIRETNSPNRPAKSLFIMVGHSFGGRVLEHGVAQPMLALLLDQKAEADACELEWTRRHPDSTLDTIVLQPPVDLIALVNPASDSFLAKSMIEGFKRAGIAEKHFTNPLIVSIKSDTDSATGPIMFVAQAIPRTFLTMRSYDRGIKDNDIPPSACMEGQLGLKTQGFYYKRSPADIYNMRSHGLWQVMQDKYCNPIETQQQCEAMNNTDNKVVISMCPDNKVKEQASSDDALYFWSKNIEQNAHGCYQLQTASSLLQSGFQLEKKQGLSNPPLTSNEKEQLTYAKQFYSCSRELTKTPADQPMPTWNDTPYYVIGVPKELIKDHNDIFEEGFINLINALIIKSDTSDHEKSIIERTRNSSKPQ